MRHIEGVTSRDLLRASGLGDDAIDAMLVRGDLELMHRGIYLERGAPRDRRRRLIAALISLGAPVAVTDQDALWVAGRIDEPEGDLALLLPHPRNPIHPRGTWVRSCTRFALCELRRDGIVPIVGEAWAITDSAKRLPRRRFARLLTRGIAERWTSVAEVQRITDLRGVFPASGKVRRVLDEVREDLPYSGAERRLAARCRRAGLSLSLNADIHDLRGQVVAKADLCFSEVRVIVEVDGPHHWLPEVAAADRVRDRRLQELGWKVIRFSVYEIDEDVDAVVREILSTLQAVAA